MIGLQRAYRRSYHNYWQFAGRAVACSLLCLMVLTAQSQRPDRWYQKGVAAAAAQEFDRAIDYLTWSVDRGAGWQSKLALADCWRSKMDYAMARKWYAQVIDEPRIPPATYFHYGQCLMAARRYEEADQWFAKYAAAAPSAAHAVAFRDIEHFVQAFQGDSARFVVTRLPINSRFADLSPTPFQNGLLFISGRPNDFAVQHRSTTHPLALLDVYYSAPDSNGRWSRPKAMTALNTRLNEGPMAIDTLGGRIFITRNDMQHRRHSDRAVRKSLNRLRIEIMTHETGEWETTALFPIHHKGFAVGHPTLSANRTVLYFVSDMPGGHGGTDIYRTRLIDGDWGPAENLGPVVNTSGNEMFPFVDAREQLYFSSNGHLGLGGLDMFSVQLRPDGSCGQVENLGYPLNSAADDFGIVTDAEGAAGYFSSHRNGEQTGDDIFAFTRDWPQFECAPLQENNYCFQYSDEGMLDIDTLPLAYEWDFGDGQRARGLVTQHCYAGPGDYAIELNIIDTVGKQIFLNQSGYLLQVRNIEQVFIAVPDTVFVGVDVVLSGESSIVGDCDLEEYYWEFGDGGRARGAAVTHRYAQVGSYEIKLGVTGTPRETASETASDCRQCTRKRITVVTPAQRDSLQVVAANVLPPDRDDAAPGRVARQPQLLLRLKESAPRDASAGTGGLLITKFSTDLPAAADTMSRAQQRQKFIDAIVLVVTDTSSGGQPRSKVVSLPAHSASNGFVRFDKGALRDLQGHEVGDQISLEQLIQADVRVLESDDSVARLQLQMPNGDVYRIAAAQEDFAPVSSYLDWITLSTYYKAASEDKRHITVRLLETLAETGESVRLDNIYFDFDSDRLRPASFAQLDRLFQLLSDHPDYIVQILAHTDNVGDAAYNLDLSNRRAKAVMQYLISKGLGQQRLTSQGLGESQPAAPNDSPANRQINRRVEFKLTERVDE